MQPKVVSGRLWHASVALTLDTYSHVVPGLQEAAAERFDKMLEEDVSRMLAAVRFLIRMTPGANPFITFIMTLL
ncbi:MAG: hypothetical protein MUO97_04655 [Dehalococcoidia bacterium]|nr:hypothetical protein [Dehalococcoidia bacterium]